MNGLCPRPSRRGRSEGPDSQRAVREVPAAGRCCRRLSGICDRPIVEHHASVLIDAGARLSWWTIGQSCKEGVGGT